MIKKEKKKVKVSLVTQSIKIFWNSVASLELKKMDSLIKKIGSWWEFVYIYYINMKFTWTENDRCPIDCWNTV